MSVEKIHSSKERTTNVAVTVESSVQQDAPADVEDTASESQEETYFDDDGAMPLLKYTRLVGSLPRLPRTTTNHPSRPFAVDCTCSAMGKVVLTPEVVLADGNSGADAPNSGKAVPAVRSSDLVWKYPHHLLAMGFRDGSVSLVDPHTAMAITPSDQLVVGSKQEPIVDVCFDSSGTFLAAVNSAGVCAIWELKFAATRSSTLAMSDVNLAEESAIGDSRPSEQSRNPFASFLTNLKMPSSTAAEINASDGGTSGPPTLITVTSPIQVSRVSYPASFGKPTAFKIDPAYKRKREKAILVGFSDGRLVLTKRGYVFQRRNDLPIYQGVVGSDYQGIQAIAWRGSLAAWADANGIKIYDTENMTKIAHIDRPTGARAALYPTISSMRPSLLYETSERLLVAWGDCVMTLTVQERVINRRPVAESNGTVAVGPSGTGSAETAVVKKRTVQGAMAWELDCVACGVVPLDDEHIAILGLVPLEEGQEEGNSRSQDRKQTGNDLELQVVSRNHGTITYADSLPILRSDDRHAVWQDSACDFRLLSSFAVQRAEDSVEAEVESAQNTEDQDFDLQMPLFGASVSSGSTRFVDLHTKWTLAEVSYQFREDDEADRQVETSKDGEECASGDAKNGEGVSDDLSVDSDDYSFVLRPWPRTTMEHGPAPSAPPPLMAVCAASDSLLVRTREVDDAISHALAANKPGLALRRALQHKRQLRQYDINTLIDEYLGAVLRMLGATGKRREEECEDELIPKHLSIRRLKLAAESMPMLLGGHVRMWEKWIAVFSKIPGGLFVLVEQVPVRDPVLPPKVYESAILAMLGEVEEVDTQGVSDLEESHSRALLQLLCTLRAWGPIQFLREMIRFYRYFDDLQTKRLHMGDAPVNIALFSTESALDRRLHQTSAGYLHFHPPDSTHAVRDTHIAQASFTDSPDSLFSLEELLSKVSSLEAHAGNSRSDADIGRLTRNQAALEVCAELNMMKGRYEVSLKYFLVIANLHTTTVEDIESDAIAFVNGCKRNKSRVDREAQRYGYVLAMVEYHHLHQCLLDDDFLHSVGLQGEPGRSEPLIPPLILLIRLIGLEAVGDFLMEHCVPPPTKKTRSPWSLRLRSMPFDEGSGEKTAHDMLPINLVAEQLTATPKLLHWYLHLIFLRKPEMYVKFASTAVPPKSITDLHRIHLDLYIKYTDMRDSSKSLAGVEVYNLERTTTPLLSFLRAALPIGGVRPEEVRRLLEAQRSGVRQGVPSDIVQDPQAFAVELAYVIEHYGEDSGEEAKLVMDLYLNGCKSLMLAVAFAQRNRSHGTMLWDSLIGYCLKEGQGQENRDGSLFGSLLECAALSGADLAHLVTQIPPGMRIEGLRPRLVAAVADYRLKLSMHKAASQAGMTEKTILLRELAHRSRRGMRFQADVGESSGGSGDKGSGSTSLAELTLSSIPKPIERLNRHGLSFALPIR